MFPFETGDCRDFKTWLEADRGIKEEQTAVDAPSHRRIREILLAAAQDPAPAVRFAKRDRVLYPVATAEASG